MSPLLLRGRLREHLPGKDSGNYRGAHDSRISGRGGESRLTYHIENARTDGRIDAQPDADWISVTDIADGQLTFEARKNPDSESRSANILLTYTYAGDQSVDCRLEAIQPPVEYDYELDAEVFTGTFFGDKNGLNGEFNYYTWLSDKPFDSQGLGQAGGTYYRFDLYAQAPENPEAPCPPEGTYRLGRAGETAEMTFAPEYSAYAVMGNGEVATTLYFTEGELTVARKGSGTHVFEATLTDTEGKTHHVSYTGSVEYEDESQREEGFRIIDKPIEFQARYASAFYYNEYDGSMCVTVQFSDGEGDAAPQNRMTLDAFIPFDASGRIAPGDYKISETETSFSCYPGAITSLMGEYSIGGTYMTVIRADGTSEVACLTDGTMTVAESGDGYEIACDFTSAEGLAMKCSYTGKFAIDNIPGNRSTLTEDYTLDLKNARATASYIGDWYGMYLGNWILRVSSEDGAGDTFLAHLSGSGLDYSAGIDGGTYKAAMSQYPWDFEYIPGTVTADGYQGTWYLKNLDSGGKASVQAPATGGTITVTNNQDGTYALSFSLQDDKGHTWNGEWSGPIETSDDSQN